jgi:two-component system, sensor histidine kinase
MSSIDSGGTPLPPETAALFAGAAHDLRQPFQTMRLFLHLLDSSLTDPGQRRLLAALEQASGMGESMLGDLLDLAALQQGLTPVSVAPVPLQPLFTELITLFQPRALTAGIRLRTVGGRRLQLDTDPMLLRRLLCCLLHNALRHTVSGGILLGVRRRDGALEIQLLDSGCGIAPEQQSAILDPFVQINPGPRGPDQGLGLGLALVSQIAARLGATLTLTSTPARGSCFGLRFPLAGTSTL